MVKNTNGSDDLADLLDAARQVARIADYHLTLGGLFPRLDADHLAVLHDDLVHWLVQHVGAAVDGAQASKALWKLAQTVQGIQVRRLAVANQRLAIQLDASYCLFCWLHKVAR